MRQAMAIAAYVMLGMGAAKCSGDGAGGGGGAGSAAVGEMGDSAGADGTSDGESGETPGAVTYHGQVRAVLDAHCTGCHAPGGAAPFSLEYDAQEWTTGAPWWAPTAVWAVETEAMPPWLPTDDCRPIAGARILDDAEKAALTAWRDAGFPEGSAASYVPPLAVDGGAIGEPNILAEPLTAYAADPALPDDYRCLPLDHTFAEDTYVTASSVYPGVRAIVHHVLVYLVEPISVASLQAKDAADDGPGYTCFGGPGVGGAHVIAAWVPGSVPTTAPTGAAVVIPAGSRLVMQIHYNTLGTAPGESVPEDLTQVAFWTMPAGQLPEYKIHVVGFPNAQIQIPAGEPHSEHIRDFTIPFDSTLIGVGPHMHMLGTEISASIVHQGGAEECLIDIPAWDFNWQQRYTFEPASFIDLKAGDVHRLRCVYDNSPANQPTVNGEQLEPRDVAWGEGTLDEMCLNYLIVMTPFVEDVAVCGGMASCRAACQADDGGCLFQCALASGQPCATCYFGALRDCATAHCPQQGAAFLQCMGGCELDTLVCLQDTCELETNALFGCVDPEMNGGACAGDAAVCGIGVE